TRVVVRVAPDGVAPFSGARPALSRVVPEQPGPAAPAAPGGDAEPLTLHLDDVDVRKALELLSREGGMNILVSPLVTGRVTANLKRRHPPAGPERHPPPRQLDGSSGERRYLCLHSG